MYIQIMSIILLFFLKCMLHFMYFTVHDKHIQNSWLCLISGIPILNISINQSINHCGFTEMWKCSLVVCIVVHYIFICCYYCWCLMGGNCISVVVFSVH